MGPDCTNPARMSTAKQGEGVRFPVTRAVRDEVAKSGGGRDPEGSVRDGRLMLPKVVYAMPCPPCGVAPAALSCAIRDFWYAFHPGHHPVCHFHIFASQEPGFASAFRRIGQSAQRCKSLISLLSPLRLAIVISLAPVQKVDSRTPPGGSRL